VGYSQASKLRPEKISKNSSSEWATTGFSALSLRLILCVSAVKISFEQASLLDITPRSV
jgi:hypothetical protein